MLVDVLPQKIAEIEYSLAKNQLINLSISANYLTFDKFMKIILKKDDSLFISEHVSSEKY